MRHLRSLEQWELLPYMGKWLIIASCAATLAGTASAFFLLALEWATATREASPWLIGLLPLAGFVVGWAYHRMGKPVEAGNNLIIDEIHDPRKVIPRRMVPLVFIGTVVSHLFGASVGREGTAVQMGGALADQLTHVFRLRHEDRRVLLMVGMSAGFAAVFGTPLAGALFGLEVLAIGRLRYDALFPCVIAGIVADRVCLAWGVHHTVYVVDTVTAMTWQTALSVIVAGIIFGLVGLLFATAAHHVGAWMKRWIAYPPFRPLIGGAVIALSVAVFHTYRYIGLGIPTIVEAFQHPLAPWDFAGKFVYTVASLGSGFKGGEVTPLFFIGATLGSALAPLLHLPVGMIAGLGFVAVFAGAANVPLACTVMAIELFGPAIAPFAAIACVASYLLSGHAGIYHAQRLGRAKHVRHLPEDLRLAEVKAYRKSLRPANESTSQSREP
ncbi:voltage-gated chloride channel family protein [Luteibacter aegosomatissinici]|uniref:voltage-gated chloride channel family protein n=1 Tax=Luteibacter aegosomatissinici TaxID=2911539 RepID=UPI001FFC157B|nr:voltage-gated chloride channel family protein [Luteibacter aegosomatissinici]UPG94561.1 voltage-gated chloride channel family protein [Luteibacter aegosomatissinici]